MGRRSYALVALLALFSALPVLTDAGCAPTTLANFPPPPALAATSSTTSATTETTAAPPATETTAPPATETTAPPAAETTAPPATETTTPPSAAVPGPTAAQPTQEATPAAPAPACHFVYRMLWPVLGAGETGSSFGQERDGGYRLHAGVDIFAPKLSPVVAVRDGVVTQVHNAAATPDCCWVGIRHTDGWGSWYLHLNNDTFGTDDGLGYGVRPDLTVGTEVRAGEVIGWVGDSGNAEPTGPHLHFELHLPSGTAIDPLYSLWAGRRRGQPALADSGYSFVGPFSDDERQLVEPIFALLVSRGTSVACDEWGNTVCGDHPISRAEATAWISALTQASIPDWPAPEQTSMMSDATIIEQVKACLAEPCPPPAVTLGETYSILAFAFRQAAYQTALGALSPDTPPPPELLPPVPPWQLDQAGSMAELMASGRLDTCPLVIEPLETQLSRAGLARLLARVLGYLPAVPCELA